MNIPKINTYENNKSNFTGHVIVTDKYHNKGLKRIANQINKMRIVRDSEANFYLNDFAGISVSAQKGKFNWKKSYKTNEKAVFHTDSIISATKRSLARYNKNKNAKRDEPIRPKPQKVVEQDTSGEPYYPFLTKFQKFKLYLKKLFNIK